MYSSWRGHDLLWRCVIYLRSPIAVGVPHGCGESNSGVSQLSEESNLRAAESFIDTFYSFESEELNAMLASAADSIPL